MGEEGRLPSPPRSVSGQKKELLLAKWMAPSVLFSWWYRSFMGVCVFGEIRTNNQTREAVGSMDSNKERAGLTEFE